MDITTIIFLCIILSVSIGLHEYAHALVSYKLGDPTPKLQGRLTPNPLKHIDPVGFLMIFLIGLWRGKPVQINPSYYKKPIEGELMVALAWPATNIVLATIAIAITLIYAALAWYKQTDILSNTPNIVIQFRTMFSFINIALAIFNLIPIPPLDGFRLVTTFFPRFALYVQKYGLYISIIFLIFLLWPGRWVIGNFIFGISQHIYTIIYTIISQFVY